MTSALVFLSTGSYAGGDGAAAFSPIPQSRHNVERLSPLLRDGLELPERPQVRELHDAHSSDEIVRFIGEAATVVEDLLLIYYCGHGVITSNGEFALTHARSRPDQVDYDALEFDRVRRACMLSPAKRRVVILDCCYSGAALAEALGADGDIGQLAISGAYVLTSSPATRPSFMKSDAQLTAFTGHLVDVLEDAGEPRAPTLDELAAQVALRLREEGLPPLQVLDRNQIGRSLRVRRTASPRYPLRERTGEPRVETSGLRHVYADLNEQDNRDVVRRIRDAAEIYFAAHTGYQAMVSQYQTALRAAIERGATLRVVVSDPDGPLMQQEEITRRLCPSIRQAGEIRDVMWTCRLHQELAQDRGFPISNVQLRLYSGPPNANFLWTDDHLRVIPYLPLVDAADSPVFEFDCSAAQPTPVAAKYLMALDRLWRDARPIDLAALPGP